MPRALYAHNFHTLWWNDLSDPEVFGFAKNQVTPLRIETSDGNLLHAWHILPRELYAQREFEIASFGANEAGAFNESLSYQLLQDPTARLVITFHGNAGHLLENTRPYLYRSLSSLHKNVHVLAFNYRGFGHSTGTPSEPGLIRDGVDVINFARHVFGIPADRIALVGQSLGTAVVSGVVEQFSLPHAEESGDPSGAVDFASITLLCGFRDLKSLLLDYRIGGIVPILSPFRSFPALQQTLLSFIRETWDSRSRWVRVLSGVLADVEKGQKRRLNLQLVHALDDPDIPYQHTELLFGELVKVGQSVHPDHQSTAYGAISHGALRNAAIWGNVSIDMRLVKLGGESSATPEHTNKCRPQGDCNRHSSSRCCLEWVRSSLILYSILSCLLHRHQFSGSA
jgi:pimeloyl-ACP methyl ester carboxylesterase